MRKKKFLLLFWILVLMIAVGCEAMLLKTMYIHMNKKVKIEEFGMEIAYPRTYVEIEKEENAVEQITSTITVTATEIIHEENTASLENAKELLYVKSNNSMITMLLQGIKTPKSEKSIEDICKDYITMFKIYHQNFDVLDSHYEEVEINGVKAGRVEIYVFGKREGIFPGVITYLFSLEDKEITLTFTGTKDIFEHGKSEIQKIVNSIKF